MTSNIVGITTNLEEHLQKYHDSRNEHGITAETAWTELDEFNASFTAKHPLFMNLYLLDDTHIIDDEGKVTEDQFTFKPGTHSTGLYAVKPGADDFTGNWSIRGNTALINNETTGQVAYGHNSNKSIKELLDNQDRQERVAWKTKNNQLTYLFQKKMAYNARQLEADDLTERLGTIRAFMKLVDHTYLQKNYEITGTDYRWDN